MFYKEENNEWLIAIEVLLPTSPPTTINSSNKENDNGWIWHDEPPQEYLDWHNEQLLTE